MGACPAHPWLDSIALGSEAWVNLPKAEKEKVFVEPGHHSLTYSFYYFCDNVKSEISKGLRKRIAGNLVMI